MTTEETMNDDIVLAVQERLGQAQDNARRAAAAFRGMSPDQLALPHGDSGKTRQQVLDGYANEVLRWESALHAAKSRP